ncbi:hypothetical protein [Limnohabitans sp.]|uniref:hypothetical protein n=1 Tax=Limnohabitans sp. TaxID=1907725 RepID=UPI0033413DA9
MSPVFALNKWPHALRATSAVSVAVSAAIMLLGCGGEGGGGISANSGSQVLLKAGESTVVAGTLESVKYRLTSMSWSVLPLAANNPVLSLSNENCAIAEKSDMLTPTPGTNSSPAGSGGSTWGCNLVVSAEAKMITADADYELVLAGVNEVGQRVTYKRALRVQPNPDINTLVPVTGYLKGMTIQPVASVCKPGAALSLQAQGIDTSNPTFNYRWRIVQGPDVVLAGADKPTVGLILPQVSVSTIMVIQLEASTTAITPENTAVYMTQAVVHVNPTTVEPTCTAY